MIDKYFSKRRDIDTPDQIQQSGLATARRARDRHEGAIFNTQRDVVKRADLLFTEGILFENVFKPYYAHEDYPKAQIQGRQG
jgi:hypothetical protein